MFKDLRVFIDYKKKSKNSNVSFLNFWDFQNVSELWFYRFMVHRNLLPKSKKIAFFSVMGPRKFIGWDHSDIKIFFTGENVSSDSLHPLYSDHLLGRTDLSMGFEYLNHDNYLRFPLWILYMIDPTSDFTSVKQLFLNIESFNIKNRLLYRDFCSLVSRHDIKNLRENMFLQIQQIAHVDSGGALLNNTNKLLVDCNNDKLRFLRGYKFNICPENTNKSGYVTEKIFEAIRCGCIPIYWGSDNNPEPEVLNHDAILFWDNKRSNENVIREIESLYFSSQKYQEFICQPRFMPKAADYTFEMINSLEYKLKEIINNG